MFKTLRFVTTFLKVDYIMNQWLGVIAWHLFPVFYRLYATKNNNDKKTYKVFIYPHSYNHVPTKKIIKEYK